MHDAPQRQLISLFPLRANQRTHEGILNVEREKRQIYFFELDSFFKEERVNLENGEGTEKFIKNNRKKIMTIALLSL